MTWLISYVMYSTVLQSLFCLSPQPKLNELTVPRETDNTKGGIEERLCEESAVALRTSDLT